MRRPLLIIMIAYCIGIVCAEIVAVPFWLIFCWLLLMLLLSAWAIFKQWSVAPWCVALALVLAGLLRMTGAEAIPPNFITAFVRTESITVQGAITEAPNKKAEGGKDQRITYICEINTVTTQQGIQPACGKIKLILRQPLEKEIYQIGDRITAAGELQMLKPGSNPGEPDYLAYYSRNDIGAVMHTTADRVQKTGLQSSYMLWRVMQKLREHFCTAMTWGMDDTEAALLKGLVFGERTIPAELEWAFADTGLVHILSVSGYHVALIAGLAYGLMLWLNWPEEVCAKRTMVCIGVYVLLVGLSAPVLRSAIMAVILLGAKLLRRRPDALHALMAAGWLMLLWDPRQLYDLGFQLSFGATGGLILLSPKLSKMLKFLTGWVSTISGTTIAATLAVLPVLACYFQQVSLISLVANLLLTFPVSLLIILGLLAAVLGSIWLPLAYALNLLNNCLASWIINITHKLAAVPLATIFIPSMHWWQISVYYIILTWLFSERMVGGVPSFRAVWENRRQRVILLLVITCVCWIAGYYSLINRQVTVTFLDVGQGDAAVVRTPNGHGILIDGGSGMRNNGVGFDAGEKVIIPFLRREGIRKLDQVIVSHGHEDHAGGIRTVLRHIPARGLLISGEQRNSTAYQELLTICDHNDVHIKEAVQGQRFIIDGVEIEILHAVDVKQKNDNEASVVIKVSYGNCSFLFTGDLEGEGERELIQSGKNLHSTILKVGHHGSSKGTSMALLEQVRPTAAVISVGRNSFGHPSPNVLQRLQTQGIRTYRTDRYGAVIIRTDGRECTVRTVTEIYK